MQAESESIVSQARQRGFPLLNRNSFVRHRLPIEAMRHRERADCRKLNLCSLLKLKNYTLMIARDNAVKLRLAVLFTIQTDIMLNDLNLF